jgi:hypothetical protein
MRGLSLKVAFVAKSATRAAFIDDVAMKATFIALAPAAPS